MFLTDFYIAGSPASFQSELDHKVVNTGKEAILQCNPEGNPKPGVTWLYKKNKVAWCSGGQYDQCHVDNSFTSRHSVASTKLTIKNVSYVSDHGNYTCVAENMFGRGNIFAWAVERD